MASINGRPRAGADDDFEVDLEEADGDVFELPDDGEVEEDDPPQLESSNLPEGMEEGEEPAGRGAKDERDDGDEEDALTQARIAADEANAAAVRAQSDAITRQAEDHWRLVQSEVSKADMALGNLNMHIENAHTALAQAKDTGDTRAEIAIQGKLQELMNLKTQIESAKAQAPTREAIMAKAQEAVNRVQSQAQQRRGTQVGDGIVAVNPLAERWAKQNDWMKTNKDASRYVVSQSKSMHKEGWDMNTPGFYAELSRRVARAFPGVKAQPILAKKKAPTRPTKTGSPVAPSRSSMSSGAPPSKADASGGRRYQLTLSDQAAMKRMNLNPQDPKHRKEFARSRIETGARSRSQA